MRGAGFALLIDALPVQSGPLLTSTFPPGVVCCVLWDERPDLEPKIQISQHTTFETPVGAGECWRDPVGGSEYR